MTDRLIIHRAPWLLPVSHPPIADGGLAVQAGKILGAGRFQEITRSSPGAEVIDHPETVLMPGLINAHTHLELSHLAHLSQEPAPASFPGWIGHMLAERMKVNADKDTILDAARAVLTQQQAQGVVAIADITNTGFTQELIQEFQGQLLCLKEYLGLRAANVSDLLAALNQETVQTCTAHAPYSTHLDLLQALRQKARAAQQVFSIHVAESLAEHDLISQGTGAMRDFLEERGFWDGSFQPTGSNSKGAVSYLHQHGLLDRQTLCVHCIHVTAQEMDLLVKTDAKVCLCPGSNRYLGVGTAPVENYLRKGLLPALGTDSLTSNPELSIWREMRLLAEEHPTVDPANILRMATLGGAEALGLDKQLGSLEAGKEARILAVRTTDSLQGRHQLHAYLVHTPQAAAQLL
ncbi:MAG: amidohydrolase family protein [Candidatus Electrothrix aestuarii]|uniref:Amidohydrolase family protein n=1 Tax=Candidatus Electrothrix aestuarii TaxID=3062594 RepID=A0AAU8LQ44_9BACT|nr:amidohydrolase family protein [Candidatus Electrothrix aestuarii]